MKKLYFLSAAYLLVLACSCSTRHAVAWRNSSLDSLDSSKYTRINKIIGYQETLVLTPALSRETQTKVGFTYHISHPDSGYTTVKILYGTDRALAWGSKKAFYYGPDTSISKGLYHVGYLTVTVPNVHKPGELERPGFFRIFNREDPKKFFSKPGIDTLSKAQFDKYLGAHSKGTDAFIFVHGFNNSFEDAALRTAQLSADIKLPMAPIMYSWASNGSLVKYGKDSINAKRAIPTFIAFLKEVALQGHFTHIHLIAHSMGNRLLADALLELYKNEDHSDLNIDEIVMAAPDIDTVSFKAASARAIAARCKRITVYAAKNDWALAISNHINHGYRLGEMGMPPFTIPGVTTVDLIDAQAIRTDFLGHSRFAESTVILNDMNKLFTTEDDAGKRGVPNRVVGDLPYYYFVP